MPRIAASLSRLALGLLLFGLCSCQTPNLPAPGLHRFAFTHPAMGTLFRINLYAADQALAEKAAQLAFHRVDALEDIMSDYQADSEVMRLCDAPYGTPVPVSADLFAALEVGQNMARASGGAFDVTVGPFVRLWRFSRKRKTLPTPAEIATARASVGWEKLRLNKANRTATLLVPNMRLDLGGLGKGYAADAALKVLKEQGITRALVAGSGDIALGAPPPGEDGWKVGITAIDDSTNATRTIRLHNAGISTSGDTEQFVEIDGRRYSHIVNPATGLGMTQRIQSTVIAPDATITDMLGTTLCVLGMQKGLALADATPGTAALVLVKEDGVIKSFASRRFPRLAGNRN